MCGGIRKYKNAFQLHVSTAIKPPRKKSDQQHRQHEKKDASKSGGSAAAARQSPWVRAGSCNAGCCRGHPGQLLPSSVPRVPCAWDENQSQEIRIGCIQCIIWAASGAHSIRAAWNAHLASPLPHTFRLKQAGGCSTALRHSTWTFQESQVWTSMSTLGSHSQEVRHVMHTAHARACAHVCFSRSRRRAASRCAASHSRRSYAVVAVGAALVAVVAAAAAAKPAAVRRSLPPARGRLLQRGMLVAIVAAPAG
eukprot:354026-Chlamydomonas_euryale.AAC.1